MSADTPWGTHFCHFFETGEDLLQVVLPFFKAGLEANEFCLWVVSEALTAEEARNALRRVIPDLDRFLAEGSIEIHRAREWYLGQGAIDPEGLVAAWDRKLAEALRRGFSGMRASGSAAWLKPEHWHDFSRYEARLDAWVADKPMRVCCSYSLETGGAAEILDVARSHNFAMAKRHGAWEVVETVNDALRVNDRRRSAVVELGQTAIRSRDLLDLLKEATAVSAASLGADAAALGEWLPRGEGLRIHAGVGWNAELVGETIPAEDGSMSAYLLRANEPVVVSDAGADSRFTLSKFALEHGALSTMAVAIRSRSHPWGVLEMHSRRPRSFGRDEVGFLQSVANVLSLAIERHWVEAAQRRERETLLESEARFRQLAESESRSRAEAEAALDRLHAIQSITDAALSSLALDDLLRELLARLRINLRAEIASVRLIDEERQDLYARAIDGAPLERVAGVRIPLDAVRLDAPVLVNDVKPPDPGQNDWYAEAWSALNLPLRAGMSTPLIVQGKAIGIVGVTRTGGPFTEDDLHLLQVVADRVAPAIERGLLGETVRAGREKLMALSRQLLTAQEEERRRLAVELHDELGQVLTAVKINLASLERQSGAATAPARLRDAIVSVDGAMERVRDLALDLRPSVLDDLGLHAAVRWYADRFARSSHVEVHLSIDAVPHLPPELETACFRVVQEALTNVARHARAKHVWVDLRLDAQALELRVRDDGIGFDAGSARERAIGGASMGLLGMQERVSLVGGEFKLSTRPEGGTEVRARFHLNERPRAGA